MAINDVLHKLSLHYRKGIPIMDNSSPRFPIKSNVMPLATCSRWTPIAKSRSSHPKNASSDWQLINAGCARVGSRRDRKCFCLFRLITSCLIFCAIYGRAGAEDTVSSIRYNAQTHVFRIDGAGMSYIFGVNETGAIQSLYWGQRLDANDPFPSPVSLPGRTSFDPSIDATPQEYVAWGGALYSVPDLKITFPDGNRDLVLHYVSYTIQGTLCRFP